jgi:DNA modification methylase
MTDIDYRYIPGAKGGCMDDEYGLPSLNDVDLVLTSIPYELPEPRGLPYTQHRHAHWSYNDREANLKDDLFRAWVSQLSHYIYRALKDQGNLYMHHRNLDFEGRCMVPHWVVEVVESAGFLLRDVLIIDYRADGYDQLYWYTKRTAPPILRWGQKVLRHEWVEDPVYPFSTFPPGLVEEVLRAHCAPGDLVVDPCAGSGVVGSVAASLGLRWVCMDTNKEYFDRFVKQAEASE